MSLRATSTRVAAAVLLALLLFVLGFLLSGAGSSSVAAPATARERPATVPGPASLSPLRGIGSVPALPKVKRKPNKPSPPQPGPLPGRRPSVRPTAPPPPPPPISPRGNGFPIPCTGEDCG